MLCGWQFKTDLKKDWMVITGKEYFLANQPGYIWNGTTTWFSACDRYVAGRGSLTVRLLGVLPIVQGSGPSYNQGELLRWRAVWSPVDDNSATLTLTDHGLTVSYQLYFDEQGEIRRYQAQRYSDETHLETWTGTLSDCRERYCMRDSRRSRLEDRRRRTTVCPLRPARHRVRPAPSVLTTDYLKLV